MRNKSHGLEVGDILTYNEYLDNANAETSEDTAPTLIPVLDGAGNIEMERYSDIVKGLKLLDGADNTFKDVMSIENLHMGSVALRVDDGMHISTFTEEYTGNKTNLVLLTPPAGKKICLREVQTDVNGNAGEIQVDFLISGKKAHRHYSAGAGVRSTGTGGHIVGGASEALTLNATSLGASKLFIRVNYIIHD